MSELTRSWIVNGEPRSVRFAPLARLLDVLREELGLTSLKEGCGEGECGACTVIIDGEPRLACLTAAAQLEDGATLLTAEGLGREPLGRALQESFAEGGAVQCGYCTPGVLLGAYALLGEEPQPGEERIRGALAGHLCRCTGYSKIVEAVEAAGRRNWSGAAQVGRSCGAAATNNQRGDAGTAPSFLAPGRLEEALALLAEAAATAAPLEILAGGTDLWPKWLASGAPRPARVLSLHRLAELRQIQLEGGWLRLGAACTHSALRRSPEVLRASPSLAEAAATIGAVQIQNQGTLGGNLINASPAADLPPPLVAAGAEVELASTAGARRLPLAELYTGYRQLARRPEELLTAVWVPALPAGGREAFRKVGTRRAQAIAKVSAACRLRLDEGGRVAEAGLALGSVAATVVRLPALERWLIGRALGEETAAEAEAQAREAVTPIDDLRSTADYRRHVVGRLVHGFLLG